ncbi:MAG: hypothetical protein JKY32_00630 [Rhizobiales bacterium]|nr:hypothetical protein [Hyphomicrobiales bacterium]
MNFRKLTSAFSAGAAGALANSVTVWLFGAVGINAALGVSIAPSISAAWLYPRIVWGGIWGFLLLLPLLKDRWLARGALFSLAPTLVQLLVVFPYKADKGMFGLDLGTMTPVLVLLFNLVWGILAAWIYNRSTNR